MKAPAPPGRHIIARSVLAEHPAGGFFGRLVVWGMRYSCEVHRTSSGVEVVLYEQAGQPEPVGAYRQPAIDDAEPMEGTPHVRNP